MGEVLGPLREGTPGQIGPYEVLARLGAGGMGEVFLGRGAAEDGVFVAVKTVRRDVAGDPAFRDRFRREIRVAALVSSAYAAAPVGGDADTEVPWLATAYVPGPSLSQAVRRGGPLPVATVRALGAQVARALADLHGAGVLHRDLKPGNVMLSVDGPRLIDFGIARSSTATTMTATGVMVGTPAFMSPEHVAGARRVTAASDVFCLGSLLCYAATGEDPFGDGPLAAVLYRVSQAEADLSRVPEELRGTVTACLALDPADRPTPEELTELLGGDAGRRFPWPEGVRDHIGEYGTELAQLVASGGPLLEVAPTPAVDPRGPVVTSGVPGLHSVPTLGPVSALPAPAGRRRRGRVLAAVLALAVVAGGLGAYLLWPEAGAKKPKAPPKAAPPAAPRIPGVDDRGLADASGIVPQNAAQRPAGWKSWNAKLTAPAFGCSAGEKVLVCRTTDGRYEALDPASGKRLWTADNGSDAYARDSYISVSGVLFLAQDSTRPTVHDGVVALVSGGRLQVRDARTGAVRWEKEAWGAQQPGTRPLVGDGMVFAATTITDDSGAEASGLTAFALSDGRPLWTKALTNADISQAEERPFEPVAYAGGTVYALSDGGLVAYDGKTGALRGQVDKDAAACTEVKILASSAYCAEDRLSRTGEVRVHLLDARTLATKGTLPTPPGPGPAVIGPNTVAAFDGGLKLFDPRSGKQTGSYAAKAAPQGLAHSWSSPLLAGDRVVYADYSALYSVRLGADGTSTGPTVTPVPGAPGPRAAEEDYDPNYGNFYAKQIRDPEVLPVGGIAYVVFDKGVVASVELPK